MSGKINGTTENDSFNVASMNSFLVKLEILQNIL
jgi:hypothetical protein